MNDKEKNNKLISENGAVVNDDNDSIATGKQGELVFENVWLFEKHGHFNRERIPERVVHAKGAGAYGTFEVTHDITKYTRAKLFNKIGKKTRVFLRFSTVAGERGAADAERDVRGFAVKFYTEDGNWDLTGNNTPVFFVRDPLKFTDFIHTQKRCPHNNLRSETAKWDFWSKNPESLHQVCILFSDRGIPVSMSHMNGYGSHTFSMFNEKNERVFVKYHFKTLLGHKTYTNQEAAELIGKTRESAQEALYSDIENKKYPKWELNIQVMPEKDALTYKINPFDLTKVWPHGDYPLIKVGVLTLNENVKNYFNEVEQSAFNPGHIVDGLGFSNDRMLQARILFYGDAHRYRLGINHMQLKVNQPKCPYAGNYHRDGLMNNSEIETTKNYNPNEDGMYETSGIYEPERQIKPEGVKHYDHREFDDDYYSQPKALVNLFSADEKERFINNIFDSLKDVKSNQIVTDVLNHFKEINSDVAEKLRELLKK